MKTKPVFNVLCSANHVFVTKDSTEQQFELHLNEKGDNEHIISGHVKDVTIAAQVQKDSNDMLRIGYFLFDVATGNHMESSIGLPEDAKISRPELVKALMRVTGHAVSTAGWYKPECRLKEVWRTVCLHLDAIMADYGINLGMFEDYLDEVED